MDEIKEFAQTMRRELPVPFDSMPDIELYMDQVLAFLSRKKVSGREGGTALTSAMINNYIKDGLVSPSEGKKYSREHLVYLTLVARLKQVLSVKDMTVLLREEIDAENYAAYYERFRERLDQAFGQIQQKQEQELNLSGLAFEFALQSYVNKVACEYLIDRLSPQEPAGKKGKAEPQI